LDLWAKLLRHLRHACLVAPGDRDPTTSFTTGRCYPTPKTHRPSNDDDMLSNVRHALLLLFLPLTRKHMESLNHFPRLFSIRMDSPPENHRLLSF
jgi:hypothetical protein